MSLMAPRLSRSWLILLAMPFLAYFAVMIYAELLEPRRLGFRAEFQGGSLVVSQILPRSPAGRADLRPGDCIRAIDGKAMDTWETWRRAEAGRDIGKAIRFDVERGGSPCVIQLVPGREPGDPWARLEKKRYVQPLILLLAGILIWRRPHRRVAQVGAWLLAAIGTAPLFPDSEMMAVWRHLPHVVGLLLWIPQISHFLLLPLLFTFLAIIPRPLFESRAAWLAVWSPAAPVAGWWIVRFYERLYHQSVLGGPEGWSAFFVGTAVLAYGLGGLTALVVNGTRQEDRVLRRKLRTLWIGACVGLGPTTLFLAAMFWGVLTPSPWVWFFVSTPYRLFALACFAAFPIALIHAVLRHRILDLTPSMNAMGSHLNS